MPRNRFMIGVKLSILGNSGAMLKKLTWCVWLAGPAFLQINETLF
jgi:hypothetical protein